MAAQYAAAAHSWNHYIHAMDCYVHALVTVVANESRLRAVSELMTDYEEAHELRIPQLERDLRRLISSLNV
jgi:hypothetical protein